MQHWRCGAVVLASLLSCLGRQLLPAQEGDAVTETDSLVELANRVRPSLVVIRTSDREGRSDRGVGTGFIISSDGLVATNLHVIGEGRPFQVELADGSRPRALAVHAADHHLDLAIIRIETAGTLAPLALADAPLEIGAPVVAMGNPFGLKHSVVAGVLSGRRVIDGREMLQLAMPIEPGNSGGPVIDRSGKVHGLITMKAALSENLGFATDVQSLRKLLERPNPVAIDRWVTIGRLPAQHWHIVHGADWRQRSGRIHVQGAGAGFGGRSLCLWRHAVPALPWELEVEVRLADETGAAGLVFHSDGGDRHYGFYPSNGKLRLTCFDGPTVFDWHILQEKPCPTYRPGEWNHLRVRVGDDRFDCFVNGVLVFSSDDKRFSAGQVGLVKFRDTVADFRRFRVQPAPGQQVARSDDTPGSKLFEQIANAPEVDLQWIEPLLDEPNAGARLRLEAERLERQAQKMRAAEQELHLQKTLRQLMNTTRPDSFDLLRATLWIAHLDDPDVDVDAYVSEVDRIAGEIRAQLPADADENTRLAALDKYLFEENGYHGSRHEYYHPANSHMHRVIDDREGLPITLSVLYMELARRLDLRVEGVGLPGHFVVRFVPNSGEPQLIDVFDRGRRITNEEAEQRIRQSEGDDAELEKFLRAATGQQIVERILRNLLKVAELDEQPAAMRRYLEALVQLDPANVQYRGMRALTRYHTGQPRAAVADLDWFLENKPPGVDLQRIQSMRDAFAQEIR